MLYIIGIKYGMTRIFTNLGYSLPVTLIYIGDNRILNIKKINNIKYSVLLTFGYKNKNKINNSILGIFIKKNIKPGKILKEFIFDKKYINLLNNCDFPIKILLNFKKVNVQGISKGKGFCGVIKRWNFKSQDASHGNSLSHRAPGSIGQNQSPGRVFKGKKMSGHYGNKNVSIKNLDIIKIDLEKKILLIKGSVPGYNGNYLNLKFT